MKRLLLILLLFATNLFAFDSVFWSDIQKFPMPKYRWGATDNTTKANNSSQKPNKKAEAEVPKYADFNSEDALMRALERSYGDKND